MSLTSGGETDTRPVSAGFRVPFGLELSGALVAPEQSLRSTRYVCPACGDGLTYRAGPIISANFAHRGGTGCTPESALHAAAKLMVADCVRAWLSASGPRPVVRRVCGCGVVRDDPIRDMVAGVTLEHRLRAGDRDLVADVALLDAAGGVRLLVEILVHHAVNADKRKALAAGSIPWIELEAESVIEEAAVWRPRAADNVRPLECEDCKAVLAANADRLRRVAAAANVSASPPGYAVSVDVCYRCHKEMPLFYWQGMFDYSRPPEPVPATVQPRDSGVVRRRYYANTCPFCRAMIGHHYAQEHLIETLVSSGPPVDPALDRFFTNWQEAQCGG